MLWGQSIVYWYFAAGYVTGISVSMFSLARMRSQINLILPARERLSLHPPEPDSVWQFFSGTNKIAHLFTILDEHRKHYPSSSLRTIFGVSLFGSVLGMIGFAMSEIMRSYF